MIKCKIIDYFRNDKNIFDFSFGIPVSIQKLSCTYFSCLVKEILRVNLRVIVASLSSKCSHVGYETFPHWVTIIPTLGTKGNTYRCERKAVSLREKRPIAGRETPYRWERNAVSLKRNTTRRRNDKGEKYSPNLGKRFGL